MLDGQRAGEMHKSAYKPVHDRFEMLRFSAVICRFRWPRCGQVVGDENESQMRLPFGCKMAAIQAGRASWSDGSATAYARVDLQFATGRLSSTLNRHSITSRFAAIQPETKKRETLKNKDFA